MNYEEKIKELTERIEKLEAIENKRKLKRNIRIGFKITEILVILTIVLITYYQINNKLIKPYQEKTNQMEDKLEEVENFVKEKWEQLQKYNIFTKR